jgi:hypothetical protein
MAAVILPLVPGRVAFAFVGTEEPRRGQLCWTTRRRGFRAENILAYNISKAIARPLSRPRGGPLFDSIKQLIL